MDFGEFSTIELCDIYWERYERLGETITQHESETILYGDSWPGAQIQIREQREMLARLQREIDNRASVFRRGVYF